VQSRLCRDTFFYFVARRGTGNAFHGETPEMRSRERTKQDREEMTRYREAPVELFSPVESGVTVAVPCTTPRAECGKFKAEYIFRARQAH